MDDQGALRALLGLDIGGINTRSSYFGIQGGKFKLQASGIASTSFGQGFQLGSGAGASMYDLQRRSDVHILKPNGELIWPYLDTGLGLDRIAVTISGGPRLRTVILGLTEKGSLQAGRTLAGSLPLTVIGVFGITDLLDQPAIIDTLSSLQPELIILTGGENGGAEKPIKEWIDILKLVCQLVPDEIKPNILFTGNALLESYVKRYLEPAANLVVVPNIQPDREEMDLVPGQAALDNIIINRWGEKIPGFKELISRTKAITGTSSFSMGRMVRYLTSVNEKTKKGVLACDLGGCSTTVAAGLPGETAVLNQPLWEGLSESPDEMIKYVHRWTAADVTKEDIRTYLFNHSLTPQFVPEDETSLAISQAYGRYRLHQANKQLSMNYPWFPYKPEKGLLGHFEPIIASGAILTRSPSAGQSILLLIDGLQPWGVTTIVLDSHHILPLSGLVGSYEPILPTHVLASDAFHSLGTVVTAVSSAPDEVPVLNVSVKAENAKDYDVEIPQGTLKRLIIPAGITAELTLRPTRETDIGFGGPGKGGRLKVPGGSMGVIIDARGRPLQLPSENNARIELLERWQLVLGG